MVRWKNRSAEDKKRIYCEQKGFPMLEHGLEKKLESIREKQPWKIESYLKDWISFHKKVGHYSKESILQLEYELIWQKRMEAIKSYPLFRGKQFDEFLRFVVWAIHKDSPYPDEMKKNFRASLAELLGPGGVEWKTKEAFPDGWKPSWIRIKETEDLDNKAKTLEYPIKKEKTFTDDFKKRMEKADKEPAIDSTIISGNPIGPNIVKKKKDDWEIAMNKAIRKKHRLPAKKKRVKKNV